MTIPIPSALPAVVPRVQLAPAAAVQAAVDAARALWARLAAWVRRVFKAIAAAAREAFRYVRALTPVLQRSPSRTARRQAGPLSRGERLERRARRRQLAAYRRGLVLAS